MRMILILLKEMKLLVLTLPLFFILGIVVGQMSQNFQAPQTTTLKIALVNQDRGRQGQKFLHLLQIDKNINFQSYQDFPTAELENGEIQGVVTIPKNFSHRIRQGERKLIRLKVANGNQNVTSLEESLVLKLISLRSDLLLSQEIKSHQLAEAQNKIKTTPNLMVERIDFEANEQSRQSVPINILALLLIFVVFFVCYYLKSRDDAKMRLFPFKNLLKIQMLQQSLLFLFWQLLIISWVFYYQEGNLFLLWGQLSGLLVYLLLLGWLIVTLRWRKIFSLIFFPWLLLNMTIGGGLWLSHSENVALALLLPTLAVLQNNQSLIWGSLGLFLLLIVSFFYVKRSNGLVKEQKYNHFR